ncbi:MAG: methyltransferase domain-containing protein, partial [Bacteroidales bacterium]|nr:methyltransferase domain-containing protein [Bacteroidales bacterium]
FYEIFSDLPRQGPGDRGSTLKAAKAVSNLQHNPSILDVGCGIGKQTLELTDYFGGKITAVDNHQPFLDELGLKVINEGLTDNIDCLNADMLNLPFNDEQFDIIWAEGSIYNIGFREGLESFKKMLKPGGYIAVTEVSWLKDSPPQELQEFWNQEYPDIKTIDQNLEIISSTDYKLVDHFTLPDSAWMDDYYIPLEKRLEKFRKIYTKDKNALALIESVQLEIDIFRKYSSYYGYVFYIMQNKS